MKTKEVKQQILKTIKNDFSTKSRPLYANFNMDGDLISVENTSQLVEKGVFIGINYKRYISFDKNKSIFFYNYDLFKGVGFSYLILFDYTKQQYIVDEKQLKQSLVFLKKIKKIIINQPLKNIKYLFQKEKDIALIKNISDLKEIFKNDNGNQFKYFWIEGENLNSGIDFKNDILNKNKKVIVDEDKEIKDYENKIFVLRIGSTKKNYLSKYYHQLSTNKINKIIENNHDEFEYKFKNINDNKIYSSPTFKLKTLVEQKVLTHSEAISLMLNKQSSKYNLFWKEINNEGIAKIKKNTCLFVFDKKTKKSKGIYMGNLLGVEKMLNIQNKRVFFRNLNYDKSYRPNKLYAFEYQGNIIVNFSLNNMNNELTNYQQKISQKIKDNDFVLIKINKEWM